MSTTDTNVFTLNDIAAWTRPGTHLAVLGHPIKHSLSPLMHNAALAEMAKQDPRYRDWHYHKFDIAPDDLPRALTLLHEKKFRGVNLTVPHKIIAFEHIAKIDPAAHPIGAVNTLSWTPAGWHGYNTDGYGLATAVRETLNLDLANRHILILGAGGAARGAAVECLQRRCASLTIANRTQSNLDALLAQLRGLSSTGVSPVGLSGTGVPPVLHHALLINATSSGLKSTDAPPIDLLGFPPSARPLAIFDMIYNPPVTPLLTQATALGIPCANGLSMLVHQGSRALEIWTNEYGTKIPAEAMRRAITEKL